MEKIRNKKYLVERGTSRLEFSRASDNQAGISIIEIIVALAIFLMIATFGVAAVVGSFGTNRLGEEHTRATLLAQEAVEATRSIKNQGWNTPFLATNCESGCGVQNTNGFWEWQGSTNTEGKYTTNVMVEPVLTDAVGNIVESGGNPNPDIRKVTARVDWDFTPTRANSVSFTTYLTYFTQMLLSGDWSNPIVVGTTNPSGNQNGVKVQVDGNYAYVVFAGGNPRFAVVDISDPTIPNVVGSIGNPAGSPLNIAVGNGMAYVVGSQNTNELQIINITNPTNPTSVGQLNTPGNGDARGAYIVGTTLYVTTDRQANNPTFYAINVSNPTSPSILGSIQLAGNAQEVVVSGNYAFVTTSDGNNELQVVNVSNPASLSLAASLNLPGTDAALTVSLLGQTALIGQGTNLHLVNISNPAAPNLIASLNVGSVINDIALANANEQYIFLATDDNNNEFVVVDVTNLTNPVVFGNTNTDRASAMLGVAYEPNRDLVVAVGTSNVDRIVVIEPN